MSGATKHLLLQAIDQAIKRCNQLRDAEESATNRDRASQVARDFVSYRYRLALSDDMPDDSMFRMEMARPFHFEQPSTDQLAVMALAASQNLGDILEIDLFCRLVADVVNAL